MVDLWHVSERHGLELQFSFAYGMFVMHGKNTLVTRTKTLYDVQWFFKSWVS